MAILHPKIADLHTKIAYRAQGSTMMGPGLKVALWHWLIRGKGQLFAKIREKQLQALKVWGKTLKKAKRNKWDSNLRPLGCETML